MYTVFVLDWDKSIGFVKEIGKFINFSGVKDEILPDYRNEEILWFCFIDLEKCEFISYNQ